MTIPTTTHRVFDFSVAGLDDYRFILPMSQVMTLVEKTDVYPVPLMPAAVRGVARFQGDLVTVVDLAALLKATPLMGSVSHMLIVTLDGKSAGAGLPVKNDATMRQAEASLTRVEDALEQNPLVAAVVEGPKPTIILDMTRLTEAFR